MPLLTGPPCRFSHPIEINRLRRIGIAVPFYWLCYRHNNQISVVIEPGASLIHARMRASLANLDEGEFTEGHEVDPKWRVPNSATGVENYFS
jgi:hypothetical protein